MSNTVEPRPNDRILTTPAALKSDRTMSLVSARSTAFQVVSRSTINFAEGFTVRSMLLLLLVDINTDVSLSLSFSSSLS